MTDEPIDHAPFNVVPEHWLVDPGDIDAYLSGTKRGELVCVGRSAGGRPIPGVMFTPAQWDRTFVLIGRTHGIEMQGTATCMNVVNLLETGACLRRRPWPAMGAAVAKLRVLIVPNLNIDAAYRCPVRTFINMPYPEVLRLEIGQWKNGRICARSVAFGPWTEESEYHGRLSRLRWLGLRYNDAGRDMNRPANLERTTSVEVRGLVEFLQRLGRVDTILDLHAHTQPPWLWAVGPMVRPEMFARSIQLMAGAQEHAAHEKRPI